MALALMLWLRETVEIIRMIRIIVMEHIGGCNKNNDHNDIIIRISK